MKTNDRRRNSDPARAAGDAAATRTGASNPKAGRPTGDELERRKVKVMHVATALFVRDGFAATSLVDIAKGAGVATRTVYQHFGDKEAIFRQVMFARETAAVFPAPSIKPDDSFFEILQKTANYILDVSLRPSTVGLMRLTIAESWRFPELTKKLTNATYSRFRVNVKGIFDELVKRGLVNDADTAASAAMFMDLILGTMPLLVYAGWQSVSTRGGQLQQKIELFVRGRFGSAAAEGMIQPSQGSRTPRRRQA